VGSYTDIVSDQEGLETVSVPNIGKITGSKVVHCVVFV
jgi:hypothetical protein